MAPGEEPPSFQPCDHIRDPDPIAMEPSFLSENQRAEVRETPYARQLTSGGGKPGQGYPAVRTHGAVRRLTPTECERLQGLPDGWTWVSSISEDVMTERRQSQMTSPASEPLTVDPAEAMSTETEE